MASIFEDHWEKTYTDNKDIIDMYRPNAPQKFKMLLIVIIKIWVVPFMNVLTAMTSSLLDTLVNLDFALHVAINIKTIELSLYYKTAYNCNHRQIVFTIPEQLRKYFFLSI